MLFHIFLDKIYIDYTLNVTLDDNIDDLITEFDKRLDDKLKEKDKKIDQRRKHVNVNETDIENPIIKNKILIQYGNFFKIVLEKVNRSYGLDSNGYEDRFKFKIEEQSGNFKKQLDKLGFTQELINELINEIINEISTKLKSKNESFELKGKNESFRLGGKINKPRTIKHRNKIDTDTKSKIKNYIKRKKYTEKINKRNSKNNKFIEKEMKKKQKVFTKRKYQIK